MEQHHGWPGPQWVQQQQQQFPGRAGRIQMPATRVCVTCSAASPANVTSSLLAPDTRSANQGRPDKSPHLLPASHKLLPSLYEVSSVDVGCRMGGLCVSPHFFSIFLRANNYKARLRARARAPRGLPSRDEQGSLSQPTLALKGTGVPCARARASYTWRARAWAVGRQTLHSPCPG